MFYFYSALCSAFVGMGTIGLQKHIQDIYIRHNFIGQSIRQNAGVQLYSSNTTLRPAESLMWQPARVQKEALFCETQLLSTVQEIASSTAKGKQIEAFDTVPHSRLLYKLDYYGMRGNARKWIKSFLSHTTQQVILDGVVRHSWDHIRCPTWDCAGSISVPMLHKLLTRVELILWHQAVCWW